MDYDLAQLVDTSKLQAILDDLYNITELPSAIFDLNGSRITASGWEELCIAYNKANNTSDAICSNSNVNLIKKVIKGKSFVVSKCDFGITNIGSPIIIEGKPIAVIAVGQFFIEAPKLEPSFEYAGCHSFDKQSFIEACKKIPVISLKKAIYVAGFVEKFAEMIAEQGLNNILLKRNEELIAQELMQANQYDQLKTEFLANVSHELRTPINIIFCSLQMLKMYMKNDSSIINSKVDRHIKMMKQNSYRLIRLIDNLIDITKIENGNFKINMSNCDIIQIIEKITASVSEYAKSKELTLLFTSTAESATLACDPDKIERIILNLLSNSIKFTPSGGKIIVSIFHEEDAVMVSVKDTGIGIPAEKVNTVFERFSQLDRAPFRHKEGSGIGLALVKSLVEMHKGSIYINTEYTEGCEIIFEIPITKLDEDQDEEDFFIVNNIERIMVEFSDIYDYID